PFASLQLPNFAVVLNRIIRSYHASQIPRDRAKGFPVVLVMPNATADCKGHSTSGLGADRWCLNLRRSGIRASVKRAAFTRHVLRTNPGIRHKIAHQK